MESVTDYKPGTVADATVCGVPHQRVFRHVVDGVAQWQTEGFTTHLSEDVTDVRPLVVLDLGGDESSAVKSLRDLGENGRYRVEGYAFAFDIAEQIEAQVKPQHIPKPALPIRIQPELGHIDTHAELLATIANATGREVCEDFNGTDLVAHPGDTSWSVRQAWEGAR